MPCIYLIPGQAQFLLGQAGKLLLGIYMGQCIRQDIIIPHFSHLINSPIVLLVPIPQVRPLIHSLVRLRRAALRGP